jgi:predicted TIM-barrel fold metal-dependent hydrolase
VAVLPLRSAEKSLEELRWAKDQGAVGIFFRGLEKDRNLDDPYFFPIYQAAMDHDMTICIHTGAGSPVMSSLFNVDRHSVFCHGRLLPLIAFRNLVANRIPELFPALKFGFVEASAGWIPFLLHALRRQSRDRWTELSSPLLFEKYRFYVACEADEDIDYLTRYVGEDHLIIGSDYGHNDPSEEGDLVRTIRSREDIPAHIADKILSDNPKRFYGI